MNSSLNLNETFEGQKLVVSVFSRGLLIEPLTINLVPTYLWIFLLILRPILSITGFVCNTFVIVMMLFTRLRQVSYGMYLTALAISDNSALVHSAFIWINTLFCAQHQPLPIKIHGYGACIISEAWPTYAMTYSSYMMILIAAERTIAVSYTHLTLPTKA